MNNNVPKNWEKVKLKKYIEIIRGVNYKSNEAYDYKDDNTTGILRANNISNNGTLNFEKIIYVDNKNIKNEQIIKKGDIIIAMSSGSKDLVGKAAQARQDLNFAFGAFCGVVRPKNINSDFLGFYFLTDYYRNKISELSTGININNLRKEYIENLDIMVPLNPKEQEEIVLVLGAMSDIIRLREKCISHAQTLIPALFQEMFKEINKYNIDVRQLVNMGIIEKPLDGNHGELHPKASDYVSQGIPFVMASDLINGKVDIYNCNFISEEQAKTLRKGFAKKDDVLISHKGTIGRTAIVQDIDTDYIVLTPQVTYYRILDDSRINKYFLKSYFDSTYFQNILLSKAQKGATRAYVGITEQLSLPIYLPDIKQQEQFANKVREINSYIEEQQEELKYAKQMFQSLLHHAFTGELTRHKFGGDANG